MASHSQPITIGVTLGDPAGIGAEVVVKALLHMGDLPQAQFVVFGDRDLFLSAASLCGDKALAVEDRIADFRDEGRKVAHLAGTGKASAEGGEAAAAWIMAGIQAAMQGEIAALVTAPISKLALKMAGYHWPGHTEMLQEKTGAARAVMMMAGGGLRIAMVTTHVAVSALPQAITIEGILSTIAITADAMKRFFGCAEPKIGVCGLNPHAGERGRFGDEEKKVIRPAIERARQAGIEAFGPVAGDVIFRLALGGEYDAVVAMFHDQATIPVKLLAFETGVNVTLGLPIIRTSPDHGTAYDIAGKGCADERSMVQAIRLAARMAAKNA